MKQRKSQSTDLRSGGRRSDRRRNDGKVRGGRMNQASLQRNALPELTWEVRRKPGRVVLTVWEFCTPSWRATAS